MWRGGFGDWINAEWEDNKISVGTLEGRNTLKKGEKELNSAIIGRFDKQKYIVYSCKFIIKFTIYLLENIFKNFKIFLKEKIKME